MLTGKTSMENAIGAGTHQEEVVPSALEIKKVPVSFTLVDTKGEQLQLEGRLNAILGRKQICTTVSDPNSPLAISIKELIGGETISTDEHMLVRSLCTSWLKPVTDTSAIGISEMIVAATEIPVGVSSLDKIGIFGRGLSAMATIGTMLAGTVLLVDAACSGGDSLVPSFGEHMKEDLGFYLVGAGERALNSLDKTYGKPGEKLLLSDFNKDGIIGFLRYVQMLPVIERLEASPELRQSLEFELRQRIFCSFLVASRQIEGIGLNGLEAVSAVISSHAGMALGLADTPNLPDLLGWIGKNVANMPEGARRKEAETTLKGLNKNCEKDAQELARQINRNLKNCTTTELTGYAAFPFTLSFKLLGLIADELEYLTKDTYIEPGFKGLSVTFKAAASVSAATPNVVTSVLLAGGTVDDAVRSSISGMRDTASSAVQNAGLWFNSWWKGSSDTGQDSEEAASDGEQNTEDVTSVNTDNSSAKEKTN
jgi:hypothetical protein